jgi:hypothetical protein
MEEMPYDEFLRWNAYFERRPIGWREDDRTAKLLQAQGVEKKATEIFPSLNVIYNGNQPAVVEDGRLSLGDMQSSSFFQQMLTARGGEILDLKEGNS